MTTPASFTCRVTANRALAPGSFVLSTDAGERLALARPGQFVMLRPQWGRDPLLPRAFSILKVEGERADFLIKVQGRGSALLSHMSPGDRLSLLGPLGRPFPVGASGDLLVAGGVGLAPLLWYAETVRDIAEGDRHHMIYGARSAGDLVLLDEVRASGAELTITTEDGTSPPGGPDAIAGRVTVALERSLRAAHAGARVLSCGPNPMMRAVAELAHAAGRVCLVSLEGEMACGVGVCLGCPVPSAPGAERPYRYCCIDGPVFDAREIVVP